MDSGALGALRRNPLFAGFPPSDLCELLAAPDVVELALGDILFRDGDDADRLFLLVSGEVALLPPASGGPAAFIRLVPGDTVGEEAVLSRAQHAGTARVTLPATAAVLDARRLMDFLETHFELAIGMISAMAGHLREQVREITELKMQSTAERLASYLVTLAGEAEGRTVVRLPCEKRHLADHLGMDPATLSRAFAKLRDKGVTASRTDKVIITDVGTLRSFGDCAALSA